MASLTDLGKTSLAMQKKGYSPAQIKTALGKIPFGRGTGIASYGQAIQSAGAPGRGTTMARTSLPDLGKRALKVRGAVGSGIGQGLMAIRGYKKGGSVKGKPAWMNEAMAGHKNKAMGMMGGKKGRK